MGHDPKRTGTGRKALATKKAASERGFLQKNRTPQLPKPHRANLIPRIALKLVRQRLEEGRAKHGDYEALSLHTREMKIRRHLEMWSGGAVSEDHLCAVVCNGLLALRARSDEQKAIRRAGRGPIGATPRACPSSVPRGGRLESAGAMKPPQREPCGQDADATARQDASRRSGEVEAPARSF
jgi:hypothetical protein